jgi:hypothetical protein
MAIKKDYDLTHQVICSPPKFTLRYGSKDSLLLSVQFFASSLLLHLFFFYNPISIGNTSRTTRFLYNNLERWTQGNFLLLTILAIFVLPWLTFAFCLIAPFFLEWSNGMTTDIGSLAAGMDGHEFWLEIGRKGLRNNGKPLAIGAPPFHCIL